jgi:3-methyladenine DNA glycosylase AlkC
VALGKHLPAGYEKAVGILQQVILHTPRGYTNLVFPDFVGLYGLNHFDTSMKALEHFTRFGSSEFAIREFLRRDFDRTMRVMKVWSKSADHHVRRLASEGCRPRLPWSFKLDRVIADPTLTLPILERLKNDPELYVRKSVANHLNDISRIDPDYFIELLSGWNRKNARIAWIIRHASRTLIKQGEPRALALLDFDMQPRFSLSHFTAPAKLRIGESLDFSFKLLSRKKSAQRLAIDYIVHYCRPGGSGKKTFKLRELELPAGEGVTVSTRRSFSDLSTRKHFPGKHVLEIQVNGKIAHRHVFRLL